MRSGFRLEQKQRIAPGMLHSLTFLRMNNRALAEYLRNEAACNPFLRIRTPQTPSSHGPFAHSGKSVDVEMFPERETLRTHLLGQLPFARLNAKQRDQLRDLIAMLRPDGLLPEPPAELARLLGVSPEEAVFLRASLQAFTPTGVGARDVVEALRLQLEEKDAHDEVFAAILTRLDLVAAHKLTKLASHAGISSSELKKRLTLLRTLSPWPGRAFAADEPTRYRHADILVTAPEHGAPHKDGGWQVSLHPQTELRVELAGASGLPKNSPAMKKALAKAKKTLYHLRAREETLLAIAQIIVVRQYRFFHTEPGEERSILPLLQKDVAAALKLHPSSISRAIDAKALDTPMGIMDMKTFFSPAFRPQKARPAKERQRLPEALQRQSLDISSSQRGLPPDLSSSQRRLPPDLSSSQRRLPPSCHEIRRHITRILTTEARPLSDAAIARLLAKDGLQVARRSVAKHRHLAGFANVWQRGATNRNPG